MAEQTAKTSAYPAQAHHAQKYALSLSLKQKGGVETMEKKPSREGECACEWTAVRPCKHFHAGCSARSQTNPSAHTVFVGESVGRLVGAMDGGSVGSLVGASLGSGEGETVGAVVGR